MSVTRAQLKRNDFWILFLAACLGFGSCNMREPGCLDVDAVNFDFEADKHDPSLCVYPNLLLNVFYQWADSSLETDHLYQNSVGTVYAIHGVQILFSGFTIRNADGDDLNIEQRLLLTIGECESGNIVDIPDDFVFVDRSAFNYVIGAFRESGPMQQFQFDLGLSDAFQPKKYRIFLILFSH